MIIGGGRGHSWKIGRQKSIQEWKTHFLYFFCYIFQLCQLAKDDPDDKRHHDQNVAKTPNIVDGNIQAGWKQHVFKEIGYFL